MRRSFLHVMLHLNVAPHSDITKFHAHKRILYGFLYFARQSKTQWLQYTFFWHLFLQFVP